MKEKIELSKLIAKTEQELKRFDLEERTMWNYHKQSFGPIKSYYDSKGLVYYSPDSVNKFVVQSYRLYCRGYFKKIRKGAALLKEFYETGTLKWRQLPQWGYVPLLPFFEKLISDFSLYMSADCQYNSIRIVDYKKKCYHFLSFLEKNGHIDLARITLKDVSDFFPAIAPKFPGGMRYLLGALRCFVRFLNEKKLSPIDITPALICIPAPRRKLQPGFTREEAEKILAVIDRSTQRGKRDYAALLLAKNTGLRSIDISNLKLNEIDWLKQEIKLTQRKTGVPLALPLEPEVGNAIADYILNARPSVDYPFVFIRLLKPFIKLNSYSFGGFLISYMKAAGVQYIPGEHKRMHAFRRGFGTQMLGMGIPLPTISEILGHTNINSAWHYLSTDLKQLQCCAIDLSDVPVTLEALQ
jgi:integrase